MLRGILNQARALGRREQIHAEIAEERDFHIAMRTAELMSRGMSKTVAALAARKAFGPGLRIQEESFDVRGGGFLEDLAGDLRFSLRTLRKTPVQTAAVIATVALGIGLNTAVFSVIRTVVLDPLPFARANDLVVLHQVSKGKKEGVSYPNFEDWRNASRSFAAMAVFASDASILMQGGQAQRVSGAVVSANLFRLLGVTPLRGRLFETSEDEAGSSRSMIISDTLWQSGFQGREDILGKSLLLDGVGYRVIGVIPSALQFPVRNETVNYWITIAVDAVPSPWGGSARTSRSYPRYEAALGRLKRGVTLVEALAELNVTAGNIARAHPGLNLPDRVQVDPVLEEIVGGARPLLWTLFAAVFCVLCVSTANAATLLLVSATARGREFALRAALGAGPWRLVRQLLAESLALAFAGGTCGALLAGFLIALFSKVAPPDTPRIHALHADRGMLLYAVGLSLLTGLFFGLAPVWAALRNDLVGTLKEGGRNWNLNTRRPSTLLIAGQIALSTILSCSAAALTDSFWRILHTPRGFDPHHVLTASISLPPAAYPERSERVSRFFSEAAEQVRRYPGVVDAGLAQSLPLSGQNNSTQVDVIGAEQPQKASADLRFVDPEYFRTVRIRLVEGRFFAASDRSGRPEVVLVNRAFAARFLSASRAIGSRLHLGWGGDAPKLVVGVVNDVLHNALDVEASPEVYVPLAQFPVNDMTLVVRTSGDIASVAAALRSSVHQMDSGVPVENVRTLDDYLLLSVAPQRFLMKVLLAFAVGTLLVAAIGLYGSLSYSAECRRHEFGVRMALGSGTWNVMRLVMRQGFAIAALGLCVGLLLTVVSSRFLYGWLYRTSALNAVTLAITCVVLIATAGIACWLPARRATRVNPVVSLRGE